MLVSGYVLQREQTQFLDKIWPLSRDIWVCKNIYESRKLFPDSQSRNAEALKKWMTFFDS